VSGIDLGVVYSAVAAIAVAMPRRFGPDASARLETLASAPGRMEVLHLACGAVLLCDYGHASLAAPTARSMLSSASPAGASSWCSAISTRCARLS